jgi:hypothetical protein
LEPGAEREEIHVGVDAVTKYCVCAVQTVTAGVPNPFDVGSVGLTDRIRETNGGDIAWNVLFSARRAARPQPRRRGRRSPLQWQYLRRHNADRVAVIQPITPFIRAGRAQAHGPRRAYAGPLAERWAHSAQQMFVAAVAGDHIDEELRSGEYLW